MLSLAALCLAAAAADQQPPMLDRVEVSRVVIDARIVDGRGRVIPSLTREEVRLEVDGRPVRLESLDWIDERGKAPGPATATLPPVARDGGAPGRLIVFLFQKDSRGGRMK